jgi:hypothetical protein
VTGYPAADTGLQTDQVGTVVKDPVYALLDYGSVSISPGNSGGPLWIDSNSTAIPQPGGPASDPVVVGVVSTSGWATQLTAADWNTIQAWEQQDASLWTSSSSTDIAVLDTTTHQNVPASAQPYSGPVAGLQHQYVYPGSDNVNISVSDDDWFLHGGPGNDAIASHGGYNVLDGGTGSNFLTGGSGTDTFFVDDRGPPADIWSTVNGFHAGDDATVFGIVPNADNSNVQWFRQSGCTRLHGSDLARPDPR